MKKHRVLALVLVFMMLMTSVAYGAIPNNSVIIGDKAFSIDYLMNEGNLAEINGAVAANGLNPIYFQLPGVADSFTNVMNGIVATQAELYALPAITYKDATGQITVYDPAFGPAEVTIVSLAPAAVTTTAGTAPMLPNTVTATMSDSTTEAVTVTWNAVDAASYAAAGSFVVYGTVAGTALQAVANVTVNAIPVGAVAAIETSVFNAIQGLEGRFTGVEPTNVVLLGTQAKVVAKAVDANGNPVSGAQLTFVITSDKTLSQDPQFGHAQTSNGPGHEIYDATATFANGLTTVTRTTGADGTTMVNIDNTVKFAQEGMSPPPPPPYIGGYSQQQNPFFNPLMAWYANQQGAATEVKYTVSYDGDAVTQDDSVAFATLFNEQMETSDNVDLYFDGALNSHANMYAVKVENIAQQLDYSSYDTKIMFPFSQVGGQTLAYMNKYASSNQVSYANSFNNMLEVTGPQIGLYVYDSQFLAGQSGNSGNTTDGLSHSVNGLLPNKTDIYTEPVLHIDGSVNYARLTFKSLSLSPGSAVSVYYVPDADYMHNGAAPTGALTANTVAYTNFAGTDIGYGVYPVAGGAQWCKTFFAVPAGFIDVTNVNEFNDYAGAMPFADKDFTVQIPASKQAGTIYVVLQTPGQIDPGMNTGYVLSRIDKNYGTQTQPIDSAFDFVKLDTHLTWNKVEIDYTYERELSETQKERLFNADPNELNWGANPNWYYTYEAPAYPQVGDAVIRAYDGNHQVQMAWSAATRTKTVEQGNRVWNENEIQIWKKDCVRPLAMDAIQRGLVGEIVEQADGVAIINSEVTGYTELHGVLDFGKDASGQDIVPLDYLNTLGCDFYAFAQWTPAPILPPNPPQDPTVLYPINQQYTMAGQRVAIEATLYDANGNLVQFKNIPVTFYVSTSGDNTVTARFVDPSDNVTKDANIATNSTEDFTVYSDVNGKAYISISAPQVAAAIVQAQAPGYTVVLKDGPVGNQQDLNVGGLTQINFGQGSLSYIPEDNDFNETAGPISMTKAIVGNPQFFGIISNVEWPDEYFGNVINLTNPNGIVVYSNEASQVIVKDMPLTLTTSEPTKFTVQKVDSTTSTDDNPTDVYGNRAGIQHWFAVSAKTGYQYITATVSGLQPWPTMYLSTLGGTHVNNPGEGIPAGLNVLNISLEWLAKGAIAQVITPATVTLPNNVGNTPVTVKVTDGVNPIVDQTVTFSLNYMTVGSAEFALDANVNVDGGRKVATAKTDANGIATVNVVPGDAGEVDQVAITVFNEATGTVVRFADGTATGSQVINWTAGINPGITASDVTVQDGGAAPVDAVKATATISWDSAIPLGDNVTVDGQTFVFGSAPSSATFTSGTELTALINNMASVDATGYNPDASHYVITVTAAVAGAAGNNIAIADADQNIAATAFTGGVDAVAGVYETASFTVIGTSLANDEIAVTVNGVTNTVVVAMGDTPTQIAAKIAVACTGDIPNYTVSSAGDVVTFTSTATGNIVPNLTAAISWPVI